MFGRWLPRENSFFDFFEQHIALCSEGMTHFTAMAKPGADRAAAAARIKACESACDQVTHRCVEALHTTFITPIERDSIYQLITVLDDIIDTVEATSERIVLYELNPIRPEVEALGQVLTECMAAIKEAVCALRSMKNAKRILELCVAINALENRGDSLLRSALARLFREERDPLEIIKWKEIFEYLEEATDRCEDVAQIVEGVVLEHA